MTEGTNATKPKRGNADRPNKKENKGGTNMRPPTPIHTRGGPEKLLMNLVRLENKWASQGSISLAKLGGP